jgi:hypothetical protein
MKNAGKEKEEGRLYRRPQSYRVGPITCKCNTNPPAPNTALQLPPYETYSSLTPGSDQLSSPLQRLRMNPQPINILPPTLWRRRNNLIPLRTRKLTPCPRTCQRNHNFSSRLISRRMRRPTRLQGKPLGFTTGKGRVPGGLFASRRQRLRVRLL